MLVRALFPHRVADTVPAIATSFTQLEGTVASDSLKVNAARGDFSPERDGISVRALRRRGVTAKPREGLEAGSPRRDQPLGHRAVSRGGRARRPGRPPGLVQPRPAPGVHEGVAWSAGVHHHG